MNANEDPDALSLCPVYRFEWSDGTTRETSDPDFTSAPSMHPDAIEALATLGRDDPDCNVHLIGMDN